jgi:hypothetical protein
MNELLDEVPETTMLLTAPSTSSTSRVNSPRPLLTVRGSIKTSMLEKSVIVGCSASKVADKVSAPMYGSGKPCCVTTRCATYSVRAGGWGHAGAVNASRVADVAVVGALSTAVVVWPSSLVYVQVAT